MNNLKVLFPVFVRPVLIFLLCCCLGNINAQVTTWTGNADTDWNNAANWDNGLPGPSFDVIIPVSSNDPIIAPPTVVNVKSVTVMDGAKLVNNYRLEIDGSTGDAITNSGILNNNGAIRIGGNTAVGGSAIVNSGTFANNNLLEIGLGAPIGGVGIRNLGTFRNNPSAFGFINIDNTNSHLIDNDAGTFDNHAELYLGLGVGSINGQAISNQAVFNNSPACSAEIVVQSDDPIRDNAGGLFTNDGLIREQTGQNCDIFSNTGIVINLGGGSFVIDTNIGTLSESIYTWTGCKNTDWSGGQNWALGIAPSSAANAVIAPSVNDPVVTSGTNSSIRSLEIREDGFLRIENGGTININNAPDDGLRLEEGTSLFNSGTINLGNTSSLGGDGIVSKGAFINQSDGTINIDQTGGVGIRTLEASSSFSYFLNEGNINIGSNGNIGSHGLLIEREFGNGGLLKIDRTGGHGIFLSQGGYLENIEEMLLIGTMATINGSGIENNGIVVNNLGGTIEVERARVGVNTTSGGRFVNDDGLLRIGDQVTEKALQNGGQFDNESCSAVYLLEQFTNESGGTFNNDGLLSVQTMANGVNYGTLTNDGIIEDVYGVLPNSITNNGIWLQPRSTDCTTVTNALQLGSTAGFTVGTTWYTDEALTAAAGTYDLANNEFQPTMADGDVTLYLSIDEDPMACPRIVSIRVGVNEDNEAPNFACPAPVTQSAVGCEGTVPDFASITIAIDNCTSFGDVTVTQDLPAGSTIGLGTTAVFLTAEDEAGNTTEPCFTSVTVVDDTAPVITCPPDVTIDCDESTDPAVNGNLGLATATDNCDDSVTPTYSDVELPGVCPAEETIQRTWIATDASGNTSSAFRCLQIITVRDTRPPSITCPSDVTVECGDATDPAATGMATGSDACGSVNIIYSEAFAFDPACGNTGTITRTWTARDGCGNAISCEQIITVADNTPLTITCPPNITVGCGDDVTPAATGMATGSDACGSVDITFSDDFDPACGNSGTITRTWTATDACGSTTTCEQVITIADTTPPVITYLPPDVAVECGDDTSPAATGMVTGSDGCGTVNITFSDSAPTGCGDSGNIIRTWTATDECGNNSIPYLQIIRVVDTTPPTITCPSDVTAECGDATDPAATGMATGSDACGSVDITFSDDFDPACGNTGTITRTWTATDECGNPTTCSQVITVVDTTPPLITCPPDVTVECDMDTSPAATGTATGSDGCGGVTITFTNSFQSDCPSSSNGNGTGTITRTWTATDDCGLMTTCQQIITIVDTSPPVIITTPGSLDVTIELTDPAFCPDGIIEAFGSGSVDPTSPNIVALSLDGVSLGSFPGPEFVDVADNCEVRGIGGSFPDFGQNVSACVTTFTLEWQAVDECGFNLSAPFIQRFTILDKVAPVFDPTCQVDQTFTTQDGNVCPTAATISLSEGDELGVNDSWTVGGNTVPSLAGCVSDNCVPDEDLIITVDEISITGTGTCTNTIEVTFSAEDGCGNTSEPFTLRYIFVDDTPPVFDLACQIDATFFTEDGNVCPADATFSLNQGDEIDVFTGWTVGGIAIDPLQGCVEDNCTDESNLTITVDDITVVDEGSCSRTITVTFIADDGCGNFSDPFVCNYTFIDNTAPAISFNGIPDGGTRTVACNLFDDGFDPLVDFNDLDLSDNCAEVDLSTLTEELTQLYDGPCANDVLTVFQQVFTVADECGNESTYTLITEIVDTTPPTFSESPADITVECVEDAPVPNLTATDACSEVISNFQEIRTDGDCPGSYTLTRTWLASDGCGNTSVETQVVTVEDTTGPEIAFIDGYINQYTPGQDVFVECSEYGNISQLIANNVIATDACNGISPVEYTFEDLGLFDCRELGYSGRLVSTWRSRDECGNESIATINWYLVDETAPVFQNLPADVCTDADNLPPVADVQAVDQCELAALTFNQSEPLDCDNGGQYIERTWTAEDACGNVATHTQRITLGGVNGLSITIDYPGIGEVENGDVVQLPADCTSNSMFSLEELEASISVADGCSSNSGEAVIETSLMGEGNCVEDGYTARFNVNINAIDACGNMAELNIMIDLVDQTPPVVTGASEVRVSCGEEILAPIATDACSEVVSMTFVDSAPIEVSCPDDPVIYQRTWTATDDCGNATTFTQQIAVLDNEGPVFSGVPVDACNNTGIDVEVSAIDGCTGEQADVSLSEMLDIEAGCGGILTRTWTATDACGNTSTATQQVFFNDEVAPTIEFTNDLLAGVQSGDEIFLTVGDGLGDPNNPLLFTAEDVIVTDNCASLTAQVELVTALSGDCAADGYLARYEYAFTATDPCGNTSIAKLTVFYVDNNAPDLFGVPGDESLFCEAVPVPADVTASDDYTENIEVVLSEVETVTPQGRLITRTWTATDDCGNTNSASQELLVVNNGLSASFSLGSTVIECNSDNNRLGVTATGGTPPYSYQWQLTDPLEDGLITTDPTRVGILFTMGYISQTFSVLITDANGCELLASITIACDFEDDEGDFTSNNNPSTSSMTLQVYPNPVNEQLVVNAPQLVDTRVTVGLYNLFGQEMLRQEVDTWAVEGLRIDTRQFPSGTYVLRFQADGQEVQAREIVIVH